MWSGECTKVCDLRVSGRGATPIVVRPAEPARKVEGLAIRNCIANLHSLIDGRPNSRTARPTTCPCRGSKLSLGWQQGLNEGAAYPDFLPPREAPSSLLASSGSHQRLPQGPMTDDRLDRGPPARPRSVDDSRSRGSGRGGHSTCPISWEVCGLAGLASAEAASRIFPPVQ